MSSSANNYVQINDIQIGRKPSVWEILSNEKNFKWMLIVPLLMVLSVFMFYPLIYCLVNSFREGGLSGTVYVGLKNYRTMMHDKTFWIPFSRTLKATIICIIAELLIGLGIATLWNKDFKGQKFIRGLILMPLLVAPLILSLVWNFLLEYNIGFINQLFDAIGIGRVKWWDSRWALYTICGITIWQWFPFSTSVLLAGLKSLPKDVYEASEVDGASKWYTFRKLTLPMLSPLMIIIVLLRAMWLLRLFDPLYGTTRGAQNTELLDWMVYRTAFVYFDVGYGSTLAIMCLYITEIIGALMFRQLIKTLNAGKA